MTRWTHTIAMVAISLVALGTHPVLAAPLDDGCIRSPETETHVAIDLYPVFSQGQAFKVSTTLTVALSRSECVHSSHLNLRVRAHEPLVAVPFICQSALAVRQGGMTFGASVEGTENECLRLPETGGSYPVRPYIDDDYYVDDSFRFDPSQTLEVVFWPTQWSLGPAAPAPGTFRASTPSYPFIVLGLPARSERETVVEFRHDGLDHYFITADPAEAAYLDSLGPAGGWRRTGLSFRARGTTRICRFYGSVSPGPNAHFFALEGPTCDLLKRLQAETPSDRPRWNFEGFSFFATPAYANGQCPVSTILKTRPVHRAYNDGYRRGIDSNHRYALDRATLEEDVRRGWVYEGVAFCVPHPASSQ